MQARLAYNPLERIFNCDTSSVERWSLAMSSQLTLLASAKPLSDMPPSRTAMARGRLLPRGIAVVAMVGFPWSIRTRPAAALQAAVVRSERLVRRIDYWDGAATADPKKLTLMQGKLPDPPVFSTCDLGLLPMSQEALLPREETPTTKAGFCHLFAMSKMTTMRSYWGCLAQVFELNGGSHE